MMIPMKNQLLPYNNYYKTTTLQTYQKNVTRIWTSGMKSYNKEMNHWTCKARLITCFIQRDKKEKSLKY